MPEGVMLTHATLVATIALTELYFRTYGRDITNKDVFLSYLPLAHVFDFFCKALFLFLGAQIGYYHGDQKTLVDDIGKLKPTFFVGVPCVFERSYKHMDGMVQNSLALKKFLLAFF
jgi:long-chain acyl-CoA synthetase